MGILLAGMPGQDVWTWWLYRPEKGISTSATGVIVIVIIIVIVIVRRYVDGENQTLGPLEEQPWLLPTELSLKLWTSQSLYI